MIPAWVRSSFVVFIGCIAACYLGSTLPEYEMFGAYLLGLAIACTICAILNNFPLLMAFGIWYPFAPPVPGFGAFPTFALVLGWIGFVRFFSTCMAGTIRYVASFNMLLLACFLWVPVRFLLSPVHKLGAGVAGGSGVSGANAYFLYAIAGMSLFAVGAILNTRDDIVSFLRWCFRICVLIGILLFICAFIPATAPFLTSMGMFAAGDLQDGVQRLVSLPGYGLFIFEAALCPALFRLNKAQVLFFFFLGLAMMIVGGNRSSMMAMLIALPMLLLLRRQTNALIFSAVCLVGVIGLMHVTVDQMDDRDIPPLMRSFGVFDSKIDEASGGKASADWRYAVWQSGLDKIMEHPLIGKGFGNLDQRMNVDAAHHADTTDFDAILAGGEAHNGFIVAAYGFGIPFSLGLTAALLLRMLSHTISSFHSDQHDPELRDLHAYLACQFTVTPVIIYTATDFSVPLLWVYIGLGIVLDQVTRQSVGNAGPPVVAQKYVTHYERMTPLLPVRTRQ